MSETITCDVCGGFGDWYETTWSEWFRVVDGVSCEMPGDHAVWLPTRRTVGGQSVHVEIHACDAAYEALRAEVTESIYLTCQGANSVDLEHVLESMTPYGWACPQSEDELVEMLGFGDPA